MDSREVLFIRTIEKKGSISAAAEDLFVSQPALTQALHRMEAKYGAAFFQRSKTMLRITDSGRAFLMAAEKIEGYLSRLPESFSLFVRSFDTACMQYAVEFAAVGTYQRVADRLGVSRSTVSRALTELMKQAGRQLYVRVGTSLTVTAEGEEFLCIARQVLKTEDDLRYSICEDSAYRGTVEIGMGTNRAMMFLSEIMPDFIRLYPRISVLVHEMSTDDIIAAINRHQLDMAIVSQTENSRGLAFDPLIEEELVMVAPKDDAFALSRSYEKDGTRYVRITDFADKAFVIGHSGQQSANITDTLFETDGITPVVVLRTENCMARAILAEKSSCFALIPHSYVSLGGEEITHYHIESKANIRWHVGLTYSETEELTNVATLLRQFILKRLNGGK